ncbi:hypothetical protein [Streptomyces sp. NPDC058605]
MGGHQLTEKQAFGVLRHYSQENNVSSARSPASSASGAASRNPRRTARPARWLNQTSLIR